MIEAVNSIPNVNFIESFLSKLLTRCRLPVECLVIMMIYLEKLQKLHAFHLSGANWRPIALTALLLSTKTWDDQHVYNIEFSWAYPQYTLKTVNKMEVAYLEMIDWKMYFEPELYS